MFLEVSRCPTLPHRLMLSNWNGFVGGLVSGRYFVAILGWGTRLGMGEVGVGVEVVVRQQ